MNSEPSVIIGETLTRCSGSSNYAGVYFFFGNRSAQTDQALREKLIPSELYIRYVIRSTTCLQHWFKLQSKLQSTEVGVRGICWFPAEHAPEDHRGFGTYIIIIIIIINALNECTNREKVLAWIKELMPWKAGKIPVVDRKAAGNGVLGFTPHHEGKG